MKTSLFFHNFEMFGLTRKKNNRMLEKWEVLVPASLFHFNSLIHSQVIYR